MTKDSSRYLTDGQGVDVCIAFNAGKCQSNGNSHKCPKGNRSHICDKCGKTGHSASEGCGATGGGGGSGYSWTPGGGNKKKQKKRWQGRKS